MESRGNAVNAGPARHRLAIPRRSCDQCRSRKIGCDRGSPCSSCVSAKLACAFGAVASTAAPKKQRVLISSQYERKIDEIAEGLEAIKSLLQTPTPSSRQESNDNVLLQKSYPVASEHLNPRKPHSGTSKEPRKWDHSAQVNDFIKTIAVDSASREASEDHGILTSLRGLAKALNDSNTARDLSFPEIRSRPSHDHLSMPPVEAAVLVLRWAKEHNKFFRIEAVSRILLIEKFTEHCRKIYFAVDEHSQLDFIIANSYLSYIFAEYIVVAGKHDYHEYYTQCRQNAQIALSRLPLLLPATVEAVAALVFGAFYAIENSKATLAWAYISNAANLSQTLGFHRIASSLRDDCSQEAQVNLFWMVFLLEKSISLRLGRSSNFRDAEVITPLPVDLNMRRCAQTSMIQGKIYDQLYSPLALARSGAERGLMAQALASELREIISATKMASYNPVTPPGAEQDKMRGVYIKIELVKQLSLLTLILRAAPVAVGSATTITDECVMAAHETLDMHHQAMASIKDSKDDKFMTHRYLHWGILHTPFVPFSVLFTRIVQLSDETDLYYLDRFSESLRFGESSAESITHPYRLYSLLCQAVRLYIKKNPPTPLNEGSMDTVDPWSVFDFASFGNEVSNGTDSLDLSQPLSHGLSHWFYGNQQLMGLLDDDVMF